MTETVSTPAVSTPAARRLLIGLLFVAVALNYVDRQVRDGGYESVDDFFQDLLMGHQFERRLTMEELRERLEKARASGISERTLPEIMAAVKAKLRADGRL